MGNTLIWIPKRLVELDLLSVAALSPQAFVDYCEKDYRDRIDFGRKCLMNVASAGKFSSDRTITQYAREIWNV